MEQGVSFGNADPLKVKALLRKICIVSGGYAKKEGYIYELGIVPKKFEGPYTSAEKVLRSKIEQLENELKQAREEKNKAVNENRSRINELNMALLSVKTSIRELIHYKQERDRKMRKLEMKIIKTVKK